ncbi:MAG: glucosyltransferase domain-containing protein [Eubacteriales bacterium]|nr:glucosyltransferase domain-containing protein [Eubacteriales bacterium]
MGENILKLYGEKVKKEWKLAFLSAVIVGFLVHTYKFTNYFPNHDGLFNFWSTQNMVASGRWLLAPACALSSCFDLPWIVGILSVVFMALTAVFLTEIFEMKNPCLIVLSSGLLVSFPAITETMFFEFTADGYMLAMLLGTVAVYLTKLPGGIHWKNGIAAAVCICLACAIYQAFVAFTFVLAVCYFMCELLENRQETGAYWKWIACQAVVFTAGLALYYGIWQLIMKLSGITPASYEGISSIGAFSAGTLLTAAKQCLTSFVWFFLERNPLQYGFSVYSVLGSLFAAAFVIACGAAFHAGGLRKRPVEAVLFFLCILSLPFGCYLCYFISPGVEYYTRMLQAIVVLYILLGVLCERWGNGMGKNLVMLLLVGVILNNSVTANVCYAYLNRCHEQSLATATELSTRIHLEDDGTAENVAFIGSIGGNWTITEEEMMDASGLGTLGPLKMVNYSLLSDHDLIVLFLDRYLDFTLEYYRTHDTELPIYQFSQTAPVPQDYILRFPMADQETVEELSSSEAFAQMGLWPGKDSVKQIGKTIVVRFSES